MRLQELFESSEGLMSYLSKRYPTWPPYVIKDFLYQCIKDDSSQDIIDDVLHSIEDQCGRAIWKFENLKITPDIFDDETRDRLRARDKGNLNPLLVPRDKQRHQQQAALLKKVGISKEPIIVIKNDDGYDLIEGWHRTIQNLNMFPQGYVGPAWVCYK